MRRLLACLFLAGCAAHGGSWSPAPPAALHTSGIPALTEPIVRGARLIPERVDEDWVVGVEPGGGLRAIVAGQRVVELPNGAMLAAPERFAQPPTMTLALPERLGGGFLFQIGQTVWRSDRWLAPARPLFTSAHAITRFVVGLDRVYLRSQNGPLASYMAFDPRTGKALDLGPWPDTPFVGGLAALDGWRAVAIADLRGAIVTLDAGTTWRPLPLPIEPKEVFVTGDALAVGGPDATPARAWSWYEVRADGQVGKLSGPAVAREALFDRSLPNAVDASLRPFGRRPLAAAIEDGWPLADGTAVVARDGVLARIRLADGAPLETVADAYPLRPSRCHAIPLPRAGDPGAFGFACGEAYGRSVLYRFDRGTGRLVELRRFDRPRVFLPSGNGAVAVRGVCAADGGEPSGGEGDHPYCVLGTDGRWREVHARGDVDGERIVVLADGRVAVLSPPHGDLATATLTLLTDRTSSTVPLTFPKLPAETARALALGVWMDGFEERRPGVLGGWVEVAGSVVGIEIDDKGHARVGELIRDAGAPVVSGRFGFGWTASRRGYETTDGGMTWTKDLELPPPIASGRAVTARACGPIGCSAAGWLRVGWGASPSGPTPTTPPLPQGTPLKSPPPIELDCDPLAGPPPDVAPTISSDDEGTSSHRARLPSLSPSWGALRAPLTSTVPPFYGQLGPRLRSDEAAISVEVSDTTDHAARTGPLARILAWGPRSGEWEHLARWQMRWVWPYGGYGDVYASVAAMAPFSNVDTARRLLGVGSVTPLAWTIAFGDDPRHVLFLGRRAGAPIESEVLAVEADRAPVAIRRADGEPLGEVDAAVRVGGHWYLASAQGPSELPATVIWRVDGTSAREIARFPRVGFEARPLVRLARRADGRAIGLITDGQSAWERWGTMLRWVLPIDLEAASVAEPELLGPVDLADRTLTACGAEPASSPGSAKRATAWILDTPLPTSARIRVGGAYVGGVSALMGRVRLTHDDACLEQLTGNLDPFGSRPELLSRRGAGGVRPGTGVAVSVFSSRTRHPLRCTKRP